VKEIAMVKAFVGHSFTPDDKNLVLSVTEFLDAFKTANSAFDWMHAEPLESAQKKSV
jgi:predicted metalloendopeptidase